MRLVMVFQNSIDIFDEEKISRENMESALEQFKQNEPKIVLKQKKGIESVVSADYIVNMSIV